MVQAKRPVRVTTSTIYPTGVTLYLLLVFLLLGLVILPPKSSLLLGASITTSTTTMSDEASVAASSLSSPPFSLLVTLNFQDNESLQSFLQDISPVAKYVQEKEPDTLAYKVLFSDKDPLQVLVLERYRDKDNAYLKIHRSSQPFLEFRPKLTKLQQDGKVTISGQSYMDSLIGFG
jgi:quinol monooxygenase YgiN